MLEDPPSSTWTPRTSSPVSISMMGNRMSPAASHSPITPSSPLETVSPRLVSARPVTGPSWPFVPHRSSRLSICQNLRAPATSPDTMLDPAASYPSAVTGVECPLSVWIRRPDSGTHTRMDWPSAVTALALSNWRRRVSR